MKYRLRTGDPDGWQPWNRPTLIQQRVHTPLKRPARSDFKKRGRTKKTKETKAAPQQAGGAAQGSGGPAGGSGASSKPASTLNRAASSMGPSTFVTTHKHASKGTSFTVRHVWRENLHSEFALLREAIMKHPVVGMDIEFPGVVARSITGPRDTPYETLRCNVDLLNPIQVGFALSDKGGNLPVVDGKEVAAWQFNFRFSLNEDMFATDSIDLLERAGVEFDFLEDHGISQLAFGELLISSGLVLEEDVTFVTFHGGFALAYLLKLMTCKDMPATVDSFIEHIRMYLPRSFDLRYAMHKMKPNWSGGSLDALGAEFGVKRESTWSAHQAGSDAWMALKTYLAMEQAKLIQPNFDGHVYTLECKQKSAPPSPGVVPFGAGGHIQQQALGSDDLHTPEKSRVNYFKQRA